METILFAIFYIMNNNFQRLSIRVKNIEKSIIFYSKVLGFKEKTRREVLLSKIPGYPISKKFPNTILTLSILSLDHDSTMLGLMSFKPELSLDSSALVFVTDSIKSIEKEFEKFGGNITMKIREGVSINPITGKNSPSYALMGLDPDEHFIEVINFKK